VPACVPSKTDVRLIVPVLSGYGDTASNKRHCHGEKNDRGVYMKKPLYWVMQKDMMAFFSSNSFQNG